MIYYWDPSSAQFLAADNVTVDPNVKTGTYVLQASVYNFHASSNDMNNLFSNNTNNVQINFRAEALQNGELITWIVNAALSTAQEFLGGSDNQSVSVGNSQNQLTNIPAPQDQITVSDGEVTISLGLQAQRKDGWWDKFLKAIGAVANSPMFAVVPMAKLIGQTVDAVTQMTDKIEEGENLVPILQGNKMDCEIYQTGTSVNPYVLRAGWWLMANYREISPYVDWNSKENLKQGIVLDFGSGQYDVIDNNNNHAPIDVTFAIIKLTLTTKTS
jgi:hypothetical protein